MTYQEWREDCEYSYPVFHNKCLKWTLAVDAVNCFPSPCISLYDYYLRDKPTKVATLSLLTDEIFYRGEDWLDQWILTKREIWLLRWLLRMGRGIESYYSYWGMACNHWNQVLRDQGKIKYPYNGFNREMDEAHKNDPLYIPSTQPIPHWHY